jgi:hypothetical protein
VALGRQEHRRPTAFAECHEPSRAAQDSRDVRVRISESPDHVLERDGRRGSMLREALLVLSRDIELASDRKHARGLFRRQRRVTKGEDACVVVALRRAS